MGGLMNIPLWFGQLTFLDNALEGFGFVLNAVTWFAALVRHDANHGIEPPGLTLG